MYGADVVGTPFMEHADTGVRSHNGVSGDIGMSTL